MSEEMRISDIMNFEDGEETRIREVGPVHCVSAFKISTFGLFLIILNIS